MATRIYKYSRTTGEYLETDQPLYAREDPLDPTNIPVPAFATLLEPPNVTTNSIQVFNGTSWDVEMDYRGTEYTDLDGETVVITELGEEVPDTSSEEYQAALKYLAFSAKAQALATEKSNRNNVYPFMYGVYQYANDETNIFGVKIASIGKTLTDPLQTFIGTDNEGCWKTDDRQYIAFTYQEFMDGIFETYFLMRSENFTNANTLYISLETLYLNDDSTVDEIEAFDITSGWSDASVAPETEEVTEE